MYLTAVFGRIPLYPDVLTLIPPNTAIDRLKPKYKHDTRIQLNTIQIQFKYDGPSRLRFGLASQWDTH